MKIVYCIPSLYNPGGMERILTEKVNYLCSAYHYDISIITTEQKGRPPYFQLDDRIKLIDLSINFLHHIHFNLLMKTIAHYRALKKYKLSLLRYLSNNDIDICISLCGKEIDFLTSLKDSSHKVAELHFAQRYREQYILSTKKGVFWRWLGEYRTKQLMNATKGLARFIVLTKEDLNKWKRTHCNLLQIYNFCPINSTKTSSLTTKRMVSIGRLDAQKGFDYLIDIWTLVVEKHSDWILDIYGQGEWEHFLTRMIKDKKLENNIYLKGVTEDVENIYIESSGYIMTSRYEGFGMVLLEAMSCGLPIVSFNCESGPAELVEEGLNGYLAQVGDIESMANYICHIIEDEDLRKKMGCKSKELSTKFNIQEIMQQWDDLFEKLTSKDEN